MKRKKRYLVGLIILVLVAGYLLYVFIDSSDTYYLTVSEFSDKGTELYDTEVRIAGKVVDDTIEWNAQDIELTFNITEGGDTLKVVYPKPKPNNFQAGSAILVEGKYSSDDGVFQATKLIVECSSKYESEIEE